MRRIHVGQVLICVFITTAAVSQVRGDRREQIIAANLRMLGSACLMYAENHDERYPPTMSSHPSLALDYGWQDLVMPWTPMYTARYNPLRRIAPDDGSDAAHFRSLQHFAMYPRAIISPLEYVRTAGHFGGPGVTHSGVSNILYDGIGGFNNLQPSQTDFLSRRVAPSLIESEVSNPDTGLVMESTNWDAWASAHDRSNDPLMYCTHWNPGLYSAVGDKFVTCGITATTRPEHDSVPRDGIAACAIPKGLASYMNVQGAVRAVDHRTYFYNGTLSQTTPGEYWIRAFNPMSN